MLDFFLEGSVRYPSVHRLRPRCLATVLGSGATLWPSRSSRTISVYHKQAWAQALLSPSPALELFKGLKSGVQTRGFLIKLKPGPHFTTMKDFLRASRRIWTLGLYVLPLDQMK